tara:strand:- start:570 stop:938 length:369 start_codon:yes stop_codon:yes gene_type:complete
LLSGHFKDRVLVLTGIARNSNLRRHVEERLPYLDDTIITHDGILLQGDVMHPAISPQFPETLIISLSINNTIGSYVQDLDLLDRSCARMHSDESKSTLAERKRELMDELALLFNTIPDMPEA